MKDLSSCSNNEDFFSKEDVECVDESSAMSFSVASQSSNCFESFEGAEMKNLEDTNHQLIKDEQNNNVCESVDDQCQKVTVCPKVSYFKIITYATVFLHVLCLCAHEYNVQ